MEKRTVRYWANTKPIVREAQRCNTCLSLVSTFLKIVVLEEGVYSEAAFIIMTIIIMTIRYRGYNKSTKTRLTENFRRCIVNWNKFRKKY